MTRRHGGRLLAPPPLQVRAVTPTWQALRAAAGLATTGVAGPATSAAAGPATIRSVTATRATSKTSKTLLYEYLDVRHGDGAVWFQIEQFKDWYQATCVLRILDDISFAGELATTVEEAEQNAAQQALAHFEQEARVRQQPRAQSLSPRGRDRACGDETGRARPRFVVKPRAKPQPMPHRDSDGLGMARGMGHVGGLGMSDSKGTGMTASVGTQSKKLDEGSSDKLDGEDKGVMAGNPSPSSLGAERVGAKDDATAHDDKTAISNEKASKPIEAENTHGVHDLQMSAEGSGRSCIPPLRTPPLHRAMPSRWKPPPKRIRPSQAAVIEVSDDSIEAAWSSSDNEAAPASPSDDDSWGAWRAAS